MATTKNITMKQYNGTDYDTLYPKTIASQIDGVYNKTEIDMLLAKKVQFTLLWENTSPTSSFEPQTITLPDNGYKYFLVVFFNYATPILVSPGKTSHSIVCSGNQDLQSGSMSIITRYFTATQTSITCTDAKSATGNWNIYNNNIVPIYIYGVEGIPV